MGLLFKKNKGFSLLEIVLSIGLTGFVIVGIVGTITEYQRSILVKGERTQGYEYLQEATRALDTLKYDRLVGYSTATPLGFTLGSNWALISGVETLGDYQRSVTLTQPDSDTVQAVINITWIGKNGRGDSLSSQVTYKSWQEPLITCLGTQAENTTLDISSFSIESATNDNSPSNRSRLIRGIRLINNNSSDCNIQATNINSVEWQNNNLTNVKFGAEGFDKLDSNFNIWSGTESPSNKNIDINDQDITGTHELAFLFDSQMTGQSLTFAVIFSDGSVLNSGVIYSDLDPCVFTQAQNTTLDTSNWSFDSIGVSQNRMIRGIRLINNTGTTCNIEVDGINSLLWQSNNLSAIKIGDLNNTVNVWTGNLAPLSSPGHNIDVTNTVITNTKELVLQYNAPMTAQNISFTVVFTDGSTLDSGIISLPIDPCISNTQAQNFQANIINTAFPDTTSNSLTSDNRIIRGIELVNTTGTACPVVLTDINEFIWTTNVNLASIKIGPKFINRTDNSLNVWTGNLTRDTVLGRNIPINNTNIENTQELLFQFSGTIFNSNNSFRLVFADGSSYVVPSFNFSTDINLCTNQANTTTVDVSQITISGNRRNLSNIRIRNNSGCRVRVTNINNITWNSTGNRRLSSIRVNNATAGSYNNTSPYNANITDFDLYADYPLEFRFNGALSAGSTLSFILVFSDGTTKPASLIIP